MSDMREALQRVRDLAPPPGAYERVLRAVEQQRAAPRPVVRGWTIGLTGAVLAAVVLFIVLRGAGEPAVGTVLLASGDGFEAGQRLSAGEPFSLEEGSELALGLPRAEVRLDGPWKGSCSTQGLRVEEGSMHVRGELTVHAPSCVFDVKGESEVEVALRHTQIVVVAGAVHEHEGSVACAILDLERPEAEPQAVERAEDIVVPFDPPAERVPETNPRPVARRQRPDGLAEQAAAYRQALALRYRDDQAAIDAWREMQRRWPRGALRQEVDVQIIDALSRLGRHGAAEQEARRFLRRHPRSSKRADVERLLRQ